MVSKMKGDVVDWNSQVETAKVWVCGKCRQRMLMVGPPQQCDHCGCDTLYCHGKPELVDLVKDA